MTLSIDTNMGGELETRRFGRITIMDLAKTLALSAVGGMVVGVVGCSSDQKTTEEPTGDSTAAATSDTAAPAGDTGEKSCCATKNECKGKGGCKATDGSHECAGKNECKGKGGCKAREC
jgi:hypothetical protein